MDSSNRNSADVESAEDGDFKILGVEDIPGAVSPEPTESAAPAGDSEASNELRNRLAAFRSRRLGAGAGGAGGAAAGGGGGGGQARAGAGARMAAARGAGGGEGMAAARANLGGAGQGAAAGAGGDPVAAGRKILTQLAQRLEQDQGSERKPLRAAITGITRGYDALEQEVARLQNELNLAHEAVRAVQRQSD